MEGNNKGGWVKDMERGKLMVYDRVYDRGSNKAGDLGEGEP